jgi:hypothetical protein
MTNGATFENGGFLRSGLEGVRLLLPLLLDPIGTSRSARGPLWPDVDGVGPECIKPVKKFMRAVYRNHLIEIRGIGDEPNAYFWILINGKRVAIAYESPLARAKEIVDLKLRGEGPASHLRA